MVADDVLACLALNRVDHNELTAGTNQILVQLVVTQDGWKLVRCINAHVGQAEAENRLSFL